MDNAKKFLYELSNPIGFSQINVELSCCLVRLNRGRRPEIVKPFFGFSWKVKGGSNLQQRYDKFSQCFLAEQSHSQEKAQNMCQRGAINP